MALISFHDVSIGFGGSPLLDGVDFRLEAGERVCLMGRNGEGKSTLLRIVAGEVTPDSGRINRKPGLTIGSLPQEVGGEVQGSVYDVVAAGMGELFSVLASYHAVSKRLAETGDEALLSQLEEAQHKLEAVDGWAAHQKIDSILTRLELNADWDFQELSGGLKRRVLLAGALVEGPDILLLDEPTNHLDIESITKLEEFLLTTRCTILFITHDRLLAQKLATRILDMDRGQLTSWPGSYEEYLRRKEDELAVQAQHLKKFDKKLSQEEVWIRQGIKARRTRNEGRVRALKEMRAERRAVRERIGTARMQLQEAEKSGRLVVRAENISFSHETAPVIRELTTTVLRGEKVGIIGPNGCGKTTLINLLLGKLSPDSGVIKMGSNLEIAYFDQLRAQLDEEATVAENVGEGKEMLAVNGSSRHVIGYLKDFLFTPDRARSPVKILSGGERNRLLLAKLFTRPANLLVLDEPTNDLDMETLELLEELLLNFNGTVLLVSHDRAFLNNVVTSTMVFEGDGRIGEYAGGYDDWLSQRKQPETAVKAPKSKKGEEQRPKKEKPRKLTFKEKKELEDLPQLIEGLEEEQQRLYAIMADPSFYQESGHEAGELKTRLEEVERELEIAYQRWEELEAVPEK